MLNYMQETIRRMNCDNSGDKLDVGFDLRVTTLVPRFIWVTEQQVLGGTLGFHALVPLNDIRLNLDGQRDHKRGIGDAHLGPVIGFHHSDKLHTAMGVDLILPTGSEYDKDDLVNLGTNFVTLQAIYALTYLDPAGLNVDMRLMHEYNFKNPDTDYKSGRELHADYAVGWGLGNGWVLGVGGYVYKQISDDKLDGHLVADNRGRAFAIGPSVQYSSASGWSLSGKWQDEIGVRNRADGSAFWLKFSVPL
uniref:MetA-pathway phenol degradation-like protein n=2 Tax=Pseudomonas TaxID=286 RepID=R9WMC9_PSEPU|nr:MetA-pathway phenol degradation-like protein [Pseudomonas putida]